MIAVSQRRSAPAASPETAEAIALTALAHLLGDADRANRFCGVTGIEGSALAGHLQDPGFLGGVLDFVLADEALLVEVASAVELPPEALAVARRQLPGAPLRD
jgi:Protein of unknown function (DUF3572)